MIQLKRAYDPPSPQDGFRVLTERFWPRDLDEKHAKIDLWLKEIAPSIELHQAFGKDPSPERWQQFRTLYWSELKDKHRAIKMLRGRNKTEVITLVHAAHNPDHSASMILKAFLEESPELIGV